MDETDLKILFPLWFFKTEKPSPNPPGPANKSTTGKENLSSVIYQSLSKAWVDGFHVVLHFRATDQRATDQTNFGIIKLYNKFSQAVFAQNHYLGAAIHVMN